MPTIERVHVWRPVRHKSSAMFLAILITNQDEESGEDIDDTDDAAELSGVGSGIPFFAESEPASSSAIALDLVLEDD